MGARSRLGQMGTRHHHAPRARLVRRAVLQRHLERIPPSHRGYEHADWRGDRSSLPLFAGGDRGTHAVSAGRAPRRRLLRSGRRDHRARVAGPVARGARQGPHVRGHPPAGRIAREIRACHPRPPGDGCPGRSRGRRRSPHRQTGRKGAGRRRCHRGRLGCERIDAHRRADARREEAR